MPEFDGESRSSSGTGSQSEGEGYSQSEIQRAFQTPETQGGGNAPMPGVRALRSPVDRSRVSILAGLANTVNNPTFPPGSRRKKT